MRLFSQRNDPVPDRYRYDIPELVRSRMLHTLQHFIDEQQRASLKDVLDYVLQQLLLKHGTTKRAKHPSGKMEHAAIEHFFNCSDEEVMDYLVFCFDSNWSCGGQPTVDAINKILEEENVGFELTAFVDTKPKPPPNPTGRKTSFSMIGSLFTPGSYIFPSAIRKDEKVLHNSVVLPCLHVLSHARFAVAHSELLKAFEEQRRGDYGDAITDAGSAFETVLKTILKEKGWAYDAGRATCQPLLEICSKNKLIPASYISVLINVAVIRNKAGDAHGKGPDPDFQVTKELADHMIYSVCANINLLISLAKL